MLSTMKRHLKSQMPKPEQVFKDEKRANQGLRLPSLHGIGDQSDIKTYHINGEGANGKNEDVIHTALSPA